MTEDDYSRFLTKLGNNFQSIQHNVYQMQSNLEAYAAGKNKPDKTTRATLEMVKGYCTTMLILLGEGDDFINDSKLMEISHEKTIITKA